MTEVPTFFVWKNIFITTTNIVGTIYFSSQIYPRVSQKFSNILVHASLQCIHHMIETVQAMKGTHGDW